MGHILDYIEKYKFAILGTVLFHIAVFAYANFSTLKRPYKIPDPEVEIAMPLEDIIVDPEMMEMLDMAPKETPEEQVYNVSSDANDNREKSFEEFSTQALDEDVSKTVEQLEQEYKDYWASQHEGSGVGTNVEHSNTTNPDTKTVNSDQGTNIQNNGDKAFAGKVMVSFSLENRKAFSLPVPGYTCNGSGKVVITVKVDKNGDVKAVGYNAGLSRNASECMIEKAMEYARKSRFNFASNLNAIQEGTITYEFKGQ